MAKIEFIATDRLPFEQLSFGAEPALGVLRVHGELPMKLLAPLSQAVRSVHAFERDLRGDDYLKGGCALLAGRLAETLTESPYHMRAFVMTTDNTALYSSDFPRNWRRATDYMNHSVAAVLDPAAALFLAIDCTAPHYLAEIPGARPLADVIAAPNEKALMSKLSSYYGGVMWAKTAPGELWLPDLL